MSPHGSMARAAALLAALSVARVAPAAPLTYDAALKLADQMAPGLEARALEVKAASTAAVAAGRLPDPKVSFGINDFPISGPLAGRPDLDNFSMLTLGLSQDVPNAAKRRARGARARADITQTQAAQMLERRKVRVAAGLAWIDLYYAERRLAALGGIERALAPLRGAALAELASGAERPAQTVEPEQLTATLADRRAGLVAAVAKARAQLGRWVEGGEAAEPAGDPPSRGVDPAGLRAGLDDLPDLRVKAAAIGQAEADADVAKAEKRPDWGYEVGYSHRDPRFGDYLSAKVTVSLPIFGARRQDPTIAAKLAEADRAAVERVQTRRDLAAALESALADHAEHDDRLKRERDVFTPLAERRAKLETASYAAGNASLSDVLRAFLALAEARIDAVDREADVARDDALITLTYGSDSQ